MLIPKEYDGSLLKTPYDSKKELKKFLKTKKRGKNKR